MYYLCLAGDTRRDRKIAGTAQIFPDAR